ncbi:MAG TPA: hypothetical protein VGH65_10525, partial [Verrucomicrobiaceae bacterium]
AWWLDKRDRQLYPEHYKALEEDEKAVAANDDWDNEAYNPWSNNEDDEEELRPASRPAPAGTQPASDPNAPAPAETPENPPVETHDESHAGEGGGSISHPESAPHSEPESHRTDLGEHSHPADGDSSENAPKESNPPPENTSGHS